MIDTKLFHDVELLGCGDCRRQVGDQEFLTEINPPGGYGRMQLLICDDCMRSGRWDHWKEEHWPNWPEPGACYTFTNCRLVCAADSVATPKGDRVMPSIAELTPCPFCGDNTAEIKSENGDYFYVECQLCKARGPFTREGGRDGARDRWDQRREPA